MSTAAVSSGPLLDRGDIDKSCKFLENIVSIFYEYCQLAQSITATHRKLAKALKEAASVKGASEFPSNTLNAAALIFEGVSEVDAKYSKVIEREYENCSAELKKWLKKLKKEDKALDEYTMAANAKIKAAGQAYERKAKRKDREAGEEHARYTNLLSTLGSEMSSAKHQHALFVTSKHTSTVYTLTGSLGRVADAQWLKTCETIRKCSPAVGPLGEGRSYVEGNYLLSSPNSLPGMEEYSTSTSANSGPALSLSTSVSTAVEPQARPITLNPPSDVLEKIAEELRASLSPPSPAALSSDSRSVKGPNASSTSLGATVEIPATTTDQSQQDSIPKDKEKSDSNNQAQEINSKPPPAITSAPDPPHEQGVSTSTDTTESMKQSMVASQSSASSPVSASQNKVTSSPPRIPTPPDLVPTALFEPSHTLARTPLASSPRQNEPPPQRDTASSKATPISMPQANTSNETRQNPRSPPPVSGRISYEGKPVGRTMSIDSTTSNGSLVAAMRDYYADRAMSVSPPPPPTPISREPKRVSGRVSDMATKFTPIDIPNPNILGADSRYPRSTYPANRPNTGNDRMSASSDNLPIRTPIRRMDEFGMQETQSTQHDWRAEELELQQKEMELQFQRQRLQLARERETLGYGSDRDSGSSARYAGRPGATQRAYTMSPGIPQPPVDMPRQREPSPRRVDHSPGCGCYDCSASKYAEPANDPVSPSRPAKGGTWFGKGIKRLSMPLVSEEVRSGSNGKRTLQVASPEPSTNLKRRSFEQQNEGGYFKR